MPFDNVPLPVTSPELEFLKAVHKLLSRKNGWCQHAFAKTRDDKNVSSIYGDDAQSFCILGAASRVGRDDFGFAAPDRVITNLLDFETTDAAMDWNDSAASRAVILRRITKSIKLLRAQLIEKNYGRESQTNRIMERN